MNTRASGTTSMPSKESCGSKTSVPLSSRRSVIRTCVRGTLTRSVKFSFRSIAGVDHAHDEVAPRIESFHGDLKLRRGRNEVERIDGSGTQARALHLYADLAAGRQVEIEGTVFPKRVSRADAVRDFTAQRPADHGRVGGFDGEAAGDPGDRDAAAARSSSRSRAVAAGSAGGCADRNACRRRFVRC